MFPTKMPNANRFVMIGVLLVASVMLGLSANAQFEAIEDGPIEKFIHQRYIHGVPYMEARALGSGALPTLYAMLKDPAEQEYWTHIVTTIGVIGDPQSIDVLVGFLEKRFTGQVNVHQFRALLLAPQSLGHIAGNGSDRSLDYLAEAVHVRYWMDKGISWSFGPYAGEDLAVLLAKVSVNGLAFSGTDRARQILDDLRLNPESQKTQSALYYNIEEGLERIGDIQAIGADNVFGAER